MPHAERSGHSPTASEQMLKQKAFLLYVCEHVYTCARTCSHAETRDWRSTFGRSQSLSTYFSENLSVDLERTDLARLGG